MTALWRVEMLGGLRVRRSEQVLTRFRTQKTAGLLAYLAFYRERAHPREILCELFWPDEEVKNARHNLSVALDSLRKQLEPPGIGKGTVVARIAQTFSSPCRPSRRTYPSLRPL